ncbi:MAG: crotonase/enoyl-CoA hydratase family protein [Planctomycetia bacterium]|nr:crotonase/enoyl-CoA hydratase family protein [Planctomycetia bacterium]
MSDFETIKLEVDPRGVALLALNRPEARNAMSQRMIEELRAAGRRLAADAQVRAVVLTGAGDHFCAGGDLKGMQQQAARSRQERIADATVLAETLAELNTLPRPVIGRINGSAFGGGLGLISICDIAIGVTTARFSMTEVRLGLVPATISPYVVARLGVRNARRVMLNATEMEAATAVELGLLDEVVEPEALDAAVEREIAACLRCAAGAVADCKRLIDFVSTHDAAANIPYTANQLADRWETDELRQGIEAFLAKRKPSWNADRP